MKTKPLFTFLVHAKSSEELAKRVADNESRGFEVVRYFETETESRGTTGGNYVDAAGKTRRYSTSSCYKKFGAVMRKSL